MYSYGKKSDKKKTNSRNIRTSEQVNSSGIAQMLVMHGRKANGRNGELSDQEMRTWIINKSGRVMNPGNVSQCVNDIIGHAGGGANYHVSHGLQGGNQGCSVFFRNPDQDHVKIFAIGQHHIGNTYRLDWGARGSGLGAGDICDVNGIRQ